MKKTTSFLISIACIFGSFAQEPSSEPFFTNRMLRYSLAPHNYVSGFQFSIELQLGKRIAMGFDYIGYTRWNGYTGNGRRSGLYLRRYGKIKETNAGYFQVKALRGKFHGEFFTTNKKWKEYDNYTHGFTLDFGRIWSIKKGLFIDFNAGLRVFPYPFSNVKEYGSDGKWVESDYRRTLGRAGLEWSLTRGCPIDLNFSIGWAF